jgi:phospholipid/cholesterol/gamma-HCH transport system substrate-binding protein
VKPFRERNPIPFAIAGIVILAALVVAAFNAQSLPFIGLGPTYYANFTDASNLLPGADVRVAGVKVGEVTGVSLHGTVVQAAFKMKGVQLGRDTSAAIQIQTLLGQNYIALTTHGGGSFQPGQTIPVSRTSTPFDVVAAFSGLSRHVAAINTQQLAHSFDVLASAFGHSAPEVKPTLDGLYRLSRTIASRNAQLSALLANANNVTGVLASRDVQVRKLIDDGDLILQTLNQQSAVIHALLVNTASLASQLTQLVEENRAILAPTLAHLQTVIAILHKDQFDLVDTFHLLAPFVRDFSNTLGSGRWFDTYVFNLPDFCGQSAGAPCSTTLERQPTTGTTGSP